MDWTTAGALVASLGGLEFIKWLMNRRAYSRRENASAEGAEWDVHEKQLERYELRLTQRDAKVDALYRELREEQQKGLDLRERVNELELEKKILEFQKCERRRCAERVPPGDY